MTMLEVRASMRSATLAAMSDPVSSLNAALEGRYRVKREIGEGGMATVYLAEDLRHERKVALKVLKPELAAVVGAERFLFEIKTTADLQHPHILPLFDSGEASGFLFYVMPFVDGESLRERLEREGQLPVGDAVRIATQVAEALEAAHQQGVVHRDIKPANILLKNRNALVTDFGIALAVSAAGAARLTRTGLSVGTPAYMSPEQAGAEERVDGRTDIYSLAAILFEMLVGRPPFEATTGAALLAKVLTVAPDRISEQRTAVPANVDAAVETALAKLPADRFPAAAAFAQALADPRYGVSAEPANQQHGRRTAAKGSRWIASVLAVVTAGVLGFGLGRLRQPGDPQGGSVIAVDIQVPAGDRIGHTTEGIAPITPSPAGDRFVYSARREGVTSLYLRVLAESGEPIPIPGTEGARGPFFSPDGEWVGFFTDDWLMKVPLSGGPPISIARIRGFAGSWGDDGTILWSGYGSPIMSVPADGGTAEPVTTLEESDPVSGHWMPHFLPGAEQFLFVAGSRIWIQDRITGERTPVTEGSNPKWTSSGLVFARGGTVLASTFDPATLDVGTPTPLIEGVRTTSSGGRESAAFGIAPHGLLVAVVSVTPDSAQLVWVDRRGDWRPVTDLRTGLSHPRVSPGRPRVAFRSDLGVVVHDLARGTGDVIADGSRPVWRGSDQVTFRASGGMYSLAASGGGPALTFEQPGGCAFPLDWSTQGSVLVYSVACGGGGEGGGSREVWTLSPDGEGTPYLNTPLDERAATLSPDGRWMAFAILEGGRPERVYVDSYPQPAERRIVTVNGAEPVWDPSGQALYYRSVDGREVWMIEFDPSTGALGGPELLFEGPYKPEASTRFAEYDISADGQEFLMIRFRESADAETLRVVVNAMSGLEGNQR
jgi:serine/threonine-protein kinase